MNQLIDENNQQFRVNEKINQRIQIITDTLNRALANTTMANKIILTEIEMIATIINIDTLNEILEDIQEAIIRTKAELISSKILSTNEMVLIKNLLVEQGINITLPDEALQYVTPKIAMDKETLLYILQVPQLEQQNSTTIMIHPLTLNDTIIADYPQYLVKSDQKLFTTSNHNKFVQNQGDIKEFQDDCIKPLVLGKKSHCNVTMDTTTSVQYIDENKIIINNAKSQMLSSDCGPNDRTLNGNFLITFWNCSVTFNNRKFTSYEIKSETKEIQGALHNLEATRQLISELNINEIAHINIENRKQLQNLHLKQWDHQLWIWSLSGSMSLSLLGLLAFIIYVTVRRQTNIIKLDDRSNSHPPKTPNLEEMKWCSNLLDKFGIKSKDEDALSSPPGGVTTS